MTALSLRMCTVFVLAGTIAGCWAPPAPHGARRGATISIALAGELFAGSDMIGFGGDLLQTNPLATAPVPQYDDQRGELVFALRVPGTSTSYPCKTRFVTRLAPDPASRAAIRGLVDHQFSTLLGLSQVAALIDLPDASTGIGTGSYELTVSRRRRTGESSWETSLPAASYPIVTQYRVEILPGDEPPAPLNYDVSGVPVDMRDGLRSLYPYPKIVLALPQGTAFGGTTTPPAAAHIVVSYPASKITIQSVFEEQHGGRGSIVSWSADEPTGRLTIDLVAPSPAAGIEPVRRLAVAFDLDTRSGAASARVASTNFSVVSASTVLYDPNGIAQSGTVSVEAGVR